MPPRGPSHADRGKCYPCLERPNRGEGALPCPEFGEQDDSSVRRAGTDPATTICGSTHSQHRIGVSGGGMKRQDVAFELRRRLDPPSGTDSRCVIQVKGSGPPLLGSRLRRQSAGLSRRSSRVSAPSASMDGQSSIGAIGTSMSGGRKRAAIAIGAHGGRAARTRVRRHPCAGPSK